MSSSLAEPTSLPLEFYQPFAGFSIKTTTLWHELVSDQLKLLQPGGFMFTGGVSDSSPPNPPPQPQLSFSSPHLPLVDFLILVTQLSVKHQVFFFFLRLTAAVYWVICKKMCKTSLMRKMSSKGVKKCGEVRFHSSQRLTDGSSFHQSVPCPSAH